MYYNPLFPKNLLWKDKIEFGDNLAFLTFLGNIVTKLCNINKQTKKTFLEKKQNTFPTFFSIQFNVIEMSEFINAK